MGIMDESDYSGSGTIPRSDGIPSSGSGTIPRSDDIPSSGSGTIPRSDNTPSTGSGTIPRSDVVINGVRIDNSIINGDVIVNSDVGASGPSSENGIIAQRAAHQPPNERWAALDRTIPDGNPSASFANRFGVTTSFQPAEGSADPSLGTTSYQAQDEFGNIIPGRVNIVNDGARRIITFVDDSTEANSSLVIASNEAGYTLYADQPGLVYGEYEQVVTERAYIAQIKPFGSDTSFPRGEYNGDAGDWFDANGGALETDSPEAVNDMATLRVHEFLAKYPQYAGVLADTVVYDGQTLRQFMNNHVEYVPAPEIGPDTLKQLGSSALGLEVNRNDTAVDDAMNANGGRRFSVVDEQHDAANGSPGINSGVPRDPTVRNV